MDFVVQGERGVYPVEVKAATNTKAKSLRLYCDLFKPPCAIRTSLAPHAEGKLVKDIPLYSFGTQLFRLKDKKGSK